MAPTAPATCTKVLRERSVLDGVIGGVPVERLYGHCYPGVAQAWEDLLGA